METLTVRELLSLECDVEEAFIELRTSANAMYSIYNMLAHVRQHHTISYAHELRTGLHVKKCAEYFKARLQPVFYGGLLHDTGKKDSPLAVLNEDTNFTDECRKIMDEHPRNGYDALFRIHPFTAEIVLRHHKYQRRDYPAEIPEPTLPFLKQHIKEIEFLSRLVAISDFYDSLMRRNNSFSNGQRTISQMKEVFDSEKPMEKGDYHMRIVCKLLDDEILRPLH